MSSPTFKVGHGPRDTPPLPPPGRESTLDGNCENRWRERHNVFCLRYRPPPASMAAGAPNSCFQDSGNAQYRRAIEAFVIDIDTGRMLLRQLMVCRTPSRDPTLRACLDPSLASPPSESGVPLLVRIRRPPLLQPLAAGDFSLEGPIRRPAVFPSQSTGPIGGAGKQGAAALMVAHTPFPLAHLPFSRSLPSAVGDVAAFASTRRPRIGSCRPFIRGQTCRVSLAACLPTTTAISNRKEPSSFACGARGWQDADGAGTEGYSGPLFPLRLVLACRDPVEAKDAPPAAQRGQALA